jgi:hypothetical protein
MSSSAGTTPNNKKTNGNANQLEPFVTSSAASSELPSTPKSRQGHITMGSVYTHTPVTTPYGMHLVPEMAEQRPAPFAPGGVQLVSNPLTTTQPQRINVGPPEYGNAPPSAETMARISAQLGLPKKVPNTTIRAINFSPVKPQSSSAAASSGSSSGGRRRKTKDRKHHKSRRHTRKHRKTRRRVHFDRI